MKNFLAIVLVIGLTISDKAYVPAFPGAEGGGSFTTGGRGGKVIFVDNLKDKGDGSFRKAIEAEGPRTILFRVSGTINLAKTIHIKNGDLTIAGQTAPGDGICLKNFGLRVDADNVIIRYIRVRPGDEMKEENDAITGTRNKNIIIDHCSFSWAMDEVASFYDNENFTLQWCIISESLYHSYHHKGDHGYGGIWGGLNASFHHNLMSDHTSRNPRLHGSRYLGNPDREKADIRNNVIYNWGFNSIYGGEEGHYNIVNNYFKPGPATQKNVRDRILDLTQAFFSSSFNKDTLRAGWFFIDGNVVEGNSEATEDNWKNGVKGKGVGAAEKTKSRLSSEVEHGPVFTNDAETAFKNVLEQAGASLVRDAVDRRIVQETKTGIEKYGVSYEGGANGIIDSPNEVGGWPKLIAKKTPQDSDSDGMPDEWEQKQGLNPQKPDNNGNTLDSNYTNLEMYINSLVKTHYPKF